MFLIFERKSRYFFFILKSKSFQFFCKATAGHKLPIPDVVFKIDKPLRILGHPLLGLAVIIGKADEVL
nr:MAG TPA: hypothetical protein [Caudoviricetes sp.]